MCYSSHHPQDVLLAQLSLYVHKSGLKPDSFNLIFNYVPPLYTEGETYRFTSHRSCCLCVSVCFFVRVCRRSKRHVHQMLIQCWPTVCDDDPTLGSCRLVLPASTARPTAHAANTRRWTSAGFILGQRRRRCGRIGPVLGQRLVFARSVDRLHIVFCTSPGVKILKLLPHWLSLKTI